MPVEVEQNVFTKEVHLLTGSVEMVLKCSSVRLWGHIRNALGTTVFTVETQRVALMWI